MILWLDLDGVVVNLFEAWAEWIWKTHGVYLDPNNQWSYSLADQSGLPVGDVFGYFKQSGAFSDLLPFSGAVSAVKTLCEWTTVSVLTAVPGGNPRLAREKHQWVSKYIPFVDGVITTRTQLKATYVSKGDIVLDDSPEVCRMCSEKTKNVICYEYPYNKNIPGVTYAKNWDEVLTIVNRRVNK